MIALAITAFVVSHGFMGVVVTLDHVSSYSLGFVLMPLFINELSSISTQTQHLEKSNETPNIEGLLIKLDAVVLYHVDENLI